VIPLRVLGRDPIFPVAVYAIVAINVAVFIQELGSPGAGAREAFINAYALIPFDLTHGIQLNAISRTPSVAASSGCSFLFRR